MSVQPRRVAEPQSSDTVEMMTPTQRAKNNIENRLTQLFQDATTKSHVQNMNHTDTRFNPNEQRVIRRIKTTLQYLSDTSLMNDPNAPRNLGEAILTTFHELQASDAPCDQMTQVFNSTVDKIIEHARETRE